MKHFKISKLFNESTVSNFVIRKCIEVNDLSESRDTVNKNIRFKTPMLRSVLCDYSDACIAVKGAIHLGVDGNNNMTQKGVVLKK